MGAWITHCMLGKELFYLREDKVQKEKGEYKLGDLKDMERRPAGGVLLNPLKHPYIASTFSPNACKW